MSTHDIALTFGPEDNLVGVLSTPEGSDAADICCLLLNVGVTHHVGPNRTSVKVARALAQRGIASFRFDLAGVGDSVASSTTLDFREQAIEDMQAALDTVQRVAGIRQFLVFGICSGAMNGLSLALRDTRVTGLAMFDGYVFQTRGTRWLSRLARLAAFPFNPGVRYSSRAWQELTAWTRAPRDRAAWMRALQWLRKGNAHQERNIFADNAPPYAAADFEADMDRLLARGVSLYLGFSATTQASNSRRGQLGMLAGAPFLSRVEYVFMPDVDHTAVPIDAQHKLCDAIATWAQRAVATDTARSGWIRPQPAPIEVITTMQAHQPEPA